jgi:4-amino-4-deoxychorismate lyase
MSNLFIVEDGRLATPDLSGCGVEGVQRGRILDWARAQGLQATVEALPLARLHAADSLVVCNSVIGAWWVRQFCGRSHARPAWHAELVAALARDA